MNDLFRFIGEERNGVDYRKGKIYLLTLERNKLNGRVIIDDPFFVPYPDWETFFKDWERV